MKNKKTFLFWLVILASVISLILTVNGIYSKDKDMSSLSIIFLVFAGFCFILFIKIIINERVLVTISFNCYEQDGEIIFDALTKLKYRLIDSPEIVEENVDKWYIQTNKPNLNRVLKTIINHGGFKVYPHINHKNAEFFKNIPLD